MTKNDINKIALHFACERLYCGGGSTTDIALDRMANRLADAFKGEDKAFDKASFLKSCGVRS